MKGTRPLRSLYRQWRERRRQHRRNVLLRRELPQSLEAIAAGLRAGASLEQAIHAASEDGEDILAQEWTLLLREMRLGASLEKALDNLYNRQPMAALQSFCEICTLVRATGGNLAGALLTLAATLRQEALFQDKLRAMTTQGRLSGYVVSMMPFLLLGAMSAVAPELMRPFFASGLGWAVLVIVIIFVSTGSWMIRKIVTIDV